MSEAIAVGSLGVETRIQLKSVYRGVKKNISVYPRIEEIYQWVDAPADKVPAPIARFAVEQSTHGSHRVRKDGIYGIRTILET